MDEDPPFTLMGFVGGLAVGGVIAGCLTLAVFALVTSLIHRRDGAPPSPEPGTYFALGEAPPTPRGSVEPSPGSGPRATSTPTEIPASPTAEVTPTARSTSIPTPTIEPTQETPPTETPAPPPETPVPTVEAPTATRPPVVPTATPSPPDLAVRQVTRLPGGTVRVVVSNVGGDLVGFPVTVIVADQTTRSELLQGGVGLRAGDSVTLESRAFTVTDPMTVIVTVDPSQAVRDADRSNNSISVLLGP